MSNENKPRSYIHYDPQRIDYSVSGEELEKLCEAGNSLWKDVCLVCSSLGVPSLINAIAEINRQAQFQLSLSIFLNCLVGGLGMLLGAIFGIAWFKDQQNLKGLIDTIKHKPKIELKPEMINIGSMPLLEKTDTIPNDVDLNKNSA